MVGSSSLSLIDQTGRSPRGSMPTTIGVPSDSFQTRIPLFSRRFSYPQIQKSPVHEAQIAIECECGSIGVIDSQSDRRRSAAGQQQPGDPPPSVAPPSEQFDDEGAIRGVGPR